MNKSILTNMEINTILRIFKSEQELSGYDFHLGGEKIRGEKTALMSVGSWDKTRKALIKKELVKLEKKTRGGRQVVIYKLSPKGKKLAEVLNEI